MVTYPTLSILVWLFSICDGYHENTLILPPRSPINKDKRCQYTRIHRMLGVDCGELDLGHVPTSLRTSIEVLDLTYNRIREIENTTFVNYPSLKMLYLTDNMISYIDGGAFAPLSDLEVLDLTANSLHFVPEALADLEILRKLMLARNPFVNVTFPATMPHLQYLSLSRCKLKKVPDFKMLPSLTHLNLSDNRIQSVELHQVAPMCRLQVLDLRGNLKLFRHQHCKCALIAKWTSQKSLEITPELGSFCKNQTEGENVIVDPEICMTNETKAILEESERISQSCESQTLNLRSGPFRLKTAEVWALSVSCFCFVIICGFVAICYLRKARRKKQSSEPLTNNDFHS